MISLHSRLRSIAAFIFFPLLFIAGRSKRSLYVAVFLLTLSLSSCYLHFFRTNTKQTIDAATISRLKSEDKYFIIHFANSTDALEQPYIEGDNLRGRLVPIPAEHSNYLHPDKNRNNRVRKFDRRTTLTEVHLYTKDQIKSGDSSLTAAISSFNRADIYELNQSATTANHIISTVGITISALIVGSIVAVAIACNCPQVYVSNNGQFDFTSGLYSGAVYSTLERTDYLPLKTIPAGATDISLKIANAKNEEQFINNVQLLRVNHLAQTNVLPDRHGNIFAYSTLSAPISASVNGKNDVKNVLMATDESYYSFDSKSNENGLSDVVLTFDKPANADKAKLVIHCRNTYWGGLLHKEFINLFGDKFAKWKDKQEKADPKTLEKWQTDQALPLMVYLNTPNGWKLVDYFPLVGNTATRDLIMEINTEGIQPGKIDIKLETAYRLWDLDYAGINYTADTDFTTTIVEPVKAVLADSTDQQLKLGRKDDQYVHLTGDQSIFFKYSVTQDPVNTTSSFFLVSGGYYHNLEPVTGKTNYSELYKFRKKGAFDRFSRKKYQQALDVAAVINGVNK